MVGDVGEALVVAGVAEGAGGLVAGGGGAVGAVWCCEGGEIYGWDWGWGVGLGHCFLSSFFFLWGVVDGGVKVVSEGGGGFGREGA